MQQKLQGLHRKAFDEQYVQGMVEDHATIVKFLKDAERSGPNGALKQFAQITLMILQDYQTMALELSNKVSQTSA
jgi:predicted outer membrane protein